MTVLYGSSAYDALLARCTCQPIRLEKDRVSLDNARACLDLGKCKEDTDEFWNQWKICQGLVRLRY